MLCQRTPSKQAPNWDDKATNRFRSGLKILRAPVTPACALLILSFLSAPSYADTAYRIVTMVSDTGGCSYSVNEDDWIASLQTVLPEWLREWVSGVEIKDTQDISIKSVDKFRITFSKKYELYSDDGHGNKVLYNVITLNGIAASAPDSIFIKVNTNNYQENINQPVKLLKCKTANDPNLPVEERIKILQAHDEQRVRNIEADLGDAVDEATGIAAKSAMGTRPFGGASEQVIDGAISNLKEERRNNVNARTTSALEFHNGRQIETREMCNHFLGAGTCF